LRREKWIKLRKMATGGAWSVAFVHGRYIKYEVAILISVAFDCNKGPLINLCALPNVVSRDFGV
jgi:hypothetical protein